MRSAKKTKNISRINNVTLSPMESEFYLLIFSCKKSSMKLARRRRARPFEGGLIDADYSTPDADKRSGTGSDDCDDESIICCRHALFGAQKQTVSGCRLIPGH